MGLKWIDRADLDRSRWQQETAACETPFAYDWVLDSVCENWAVVGREEGHFLKAFAFRRKWGFSWVYQPFFVRLIEPIQEPTAAEWRAIYRLLDSRTRYWHFQTSSTAAPEAVPGIAVHMRQYQQLSLGSTHEENRARYSQNAKRILKSNKAESLVIRDLSAEEFLSFFRKHTQSKIGDLRELDIGRLRQLILTSLQRGRGMVTGCFDGNELLACGYFLESDQRAVYIKGSTSAEGQQKGAMYVLMDHALATYTGRKSVFDFGGSSIESIADFFKKFGATDHTYYRVERQPSFFVSFARWLYHHLSGK
ncbi:MAG TPA: GNAT family N-acetyltransferase [Luteibaculaceae bacterium]|nr:GNAT family N-acetyltransferase [Luteibaculaceae bacterium]